MAIIKPFKGIRPPQDLVEQVASRPYDVLNSEEARAEAEGNEKISLSVRTNTTNKCMLKLPRISNCSRIKAGWCRIIRKIIISMPKR